MTSGYIKLFNVKINDCTTQAAGTGSIIINFISENCTTSGAWATVDVVNLIQ